MINENSSHGEILKGAIEEFFAFLTLGLVGFGYLIACFSKTMAGGYYIFLFVGAIFLIIIKKIKKKRSKK